jgi:hypothetical protein
VLNVHVSSPIYQIRLNSITVAHIGRLGHAVHVADALVQAAAEVERGVSLGEPHAQAKGLLGVRVLSNIHVNNHIRRD